MGSADLASVSLFAGLSATALERLRAGMRPRSYAVGEPICVEGEAGDTMFVLASGLAHVVVGDGEARQVLARLRRGDVLGEMSLLTGEPRSATAVAAAPTQALELDRRTFTALLATEPALLDNLVRLLRERLVASNRRGLRPRTSASALIVGRGGEAAAAQVIAAAQRVRAAPLRVGDRRQGASIAALLDANEREDVLAVLGPEDPALAGVLDHVDRVAVVGEPELGARGARLTRHEDPAWLGRFLARGRLGLALGAGGARGYAHVGALHALEAAGYRPDAVAGSSIGGVVGALVAMGLGAAEVEAAMRRAFTPEAVTALFKLSLGPNSPAMALWTRLTRELTEDRSFADLKLPLVILCADLETGQPAPLTDGPVWEALLATTALPGMAPPVRRGAARLVDGLALVPVPTRAVEAHSDVTVAVNLMSRDRLPAWPGEEPVIAAKGGSALDVLLEALELTHTDSSVRCAALADVPITPRFGPSTWKDFHRADAFLAAGQAATDASLPALGALLRPSQEPA